ncbi:TPA: hypothetical protein ACTWZX_001408 [Raoultella ornithinolytica]
MGRKSRLKKERKESHVGERNLKSSKTEDFSRPVYRFFKEKDHAEALCQGKVWLSTLQTCRAYEDPQQGDRDEAKHTYSIPYMSGSSSDPNIVEMSSRLGINIKAGNCNIRVIRGTSLTLIEDAFVLCTTKKYDPSKMNDTFGNYCVKISNPKEFFENVSDELNKVIPLKWGGMGAVIYGKREFTGLENAPGPIGFVKPKDIYSEQKEFRFLWESAEQKIIKPFELYCPLIAKLCKIIN